MKRLVVEVLTTEWGKLLKIKEQTCRADDFGSNNNDFGSNNEDFVASNGFKLHSGEYPEIWHGNLFVRGTDMSKDHIAQLCPSEEWLGNLRVAVREYNVKFWDFGEKLVFGNIETIE